jgi:transposase
VFFAHRIRLELNEVQATGLSKAAGVARFAYNWALGEWQRQYDLSKTDPALPRPSQAALRRQRNAVKRDAFPWLEVTKNAPQMATIQLGQAFDNFFSTSFPAIRGSAEKAVTTVLRSPTISSASKKNAFASRSWDVVSVLQQLRCPVWVSIQRLFS